MGNYNRDRGSRGGGRSFGGGGFRDRSSFNRGRRDDRQMFSTICNNCHKDCEVPFRPTGDKPVYCNDCFEKMGDRGERKSFDRPRFSEGRGQDNQYKAQFETINAKLDKVLSLLQPKQTVAPKPEIETVAEKPIEETKTKSSKSRKATL